jgi:hypothetical protein
LLSALIVAAATTAIVVPTLASAATGCQVTYAKAWDNGSGFGANLTLQNLGDPMTSWTLTFTFPGNQQATQGWSGNWSQSGANVTVTSMSWNGVQGTGASWGIGFNGSYSGTNTNPSTFRLNGVTCTGSVSSPSPSPVAIQREPRAHGQPDQPGQRRHVHRAGHDQPRRHRDRPDNNLARVEFYNGTTLLGSDTSSPYTFTWPGVNQGTYSVSARAVDTGNLTATSGAAHVTVLRWTVGGPPRLHVSGNKLLTSTRRHRIGSRCQPLRRRVRLHPGQRHLGRADGPGLVTAMRTWKVRAVRVPLNEQCWLGVVSGATAYSGVPPIRTRSRPT